MQVVIGWALWFSSLAGITSGTLWQLTLLSPQNGAIISQVPQDYISVSGGFYRPNNGKPPIKGDVTCNGVAGTINTTARTWVVSGVHLNPGINAITCQYNEKNDVSIAQIQVTYQGGETLPPIAGFQYSPSSGTSPLLVSFDASESYDPDGGNVVSYEWTFGDGATLTTYSPVVGHMYSSVGTFQAQLQVRDDEGILSDPVIYSIETYQQNYPPVAMFAVTPASGTAPLQTTLDAMSSYDPDGGVIVEYQWNFGTGDTLNTAVPILDYTFQSAGSFVITLVVKDDENELSAPLTFNIEVNESGQIAGIKGITYKENQGVVPNVPVTVTFNSDGTSFNTTSDANGKFSFNPTSSGDFTLTAQLDDLKATTSNSWSQADSLEVPVSLRKFGIGRVSGTIILNDGSGAAYDSKVLLKFFNGGDEYLTKADGDGNFSFDNLPLQGNFYFSSFHPDTGARRSFYGFIDNDVPEQNNIVLGISAAQNFPPFTNGAFAFGGFDGWSGVGNNALVPQSDAFASIKTSHKFFSDTIRPIPDHLGLISPHEREKHKVPSRTHMISTQKQKIEERSTLPCENNNFSIVTANVGPEATGGQVLQDITIEPDAETLIGRIRLLTNETIEAANLGYNDSFFVLLANPVRPRFIFLGDIKTITWKPGILGYKYTSDEITFAVDVRDIAGMSALLGGAAIDRGDTFGDSAIVLSNLQFLTSADRNFATTGSWSGSSTFSQNLGAVNWFKVKNTKEISAINLNNSFSVLKKNEEAEIPFVKFGVEPRVQDFNVNTLLSSDIFTYSLNSTWVSSMPTSVCALKGGK